MIEMQEGRLECNPKYIEQNCLMYFLRVQYTDRCLLTIVSSHDCHEAMIVSKSRLFNEILYKKKKSKSVLLYVFNITFLLSLLSIIYPGNLAEAILSSISPAQCVCSKTRGGKYNKITPWVWGSSWGQNKGNSWEHYFLSSLGLLISIQLPLLWIFSFRGQKQKNWEWRIKIVEML